ncbi:MAG: hypothetical protein AAGJ10_03230 [Bacteroidota bacterium]
MTSRPKVPKPKPVTVTQPVQEPDPGTSEIDNNDLPVNEEEARKEGLLSRNRGRFGTVQTSFRGLLSSKNQNNEPKTLLGE